MGWPGWVKEGFGGQRTLVSTFQPPLHLHCLDGRQTSVFRPCLNAPYWETQLWYQPLLTAMLTVCPLTRVCAEKDVTRTDRGEAFFAGTSNITLLHDILVTYCMYNFDLGYVQVGLRYSWSSPGGLRPFWLSAGPSSAFVRVQIAVPLTTRAVKHITSCKRS